MEYEQKKPPKPKKRNPEQYADYIESYVNNQEELSKIRYDNYLEGFKCQ